jgi:hypothetical protein
MSFRAAHPHRHLASASPPRVRIATSHQRHRLASASLPRGARPRRAALIADGVVREPRAFERAVVSRAFD